jgi:hypothetical protein
MHRGKLAFVRHELSRSDWRDGGTAGRGYITQIRRVAMTEAEYLDPKRPLTTQKGLSLKEQKMIDAINRDDIRQILEESRPLDLEQARSPASGR